MLFYILILSLILYYPLSLRWSLLCNNLFLIYNLSFYLPILSYFSVLLSDLGHLQTFSLNLYLRSCLFWLLYQFQFFYFLLLFCLIILQTYLTSSSKSNSPFDDSFALTSAFCIIQFLMVESIQFRIYFYYISFNILFANHRFESISLSKDLKFFFDFLCFKFLEERMKIIKSIKWQQICIVYFWIFFKVHSYLR